MLESLDGGPPEQPSSDGSTGSSVAVGEIERLTIHADTQKQRIRELEQGVTQLQHALDARVTIERAIGMLAERFGLQLADAVELLRSAARHGRLETRELANEITESREATPAPITEALRRRDSGAE
jgi:hypothetical protein